MTKITLKIESEDDNCPSAKDIIEQLEADFEELGMAVKVTLVEVKDETNSN